MLVCNIIVLFGKMVDYMYVAILTA